MKATELQSEIEKGNEHNYHISPFIIKTEMAKEIFMGFIKNDQRRGKMKKVFLSRFM